MIIARNKTMPDSSDSFTHTSDFVTEEVKFPVHGQYTGNDCMILPPRNTREALY